MSKETNATFDQLGQDMLDEAAGVDCSVPEYIEGLESILENIQTHLAAAKQDLKDEDEDSGEEDDIESDED